MAHMPGARWSARLVIDIVAAVLAICRDARARIGIADDAGGEPRRRRAAPAVAAVQLLRRAGDARHCSAAPSWPRSPARPGDRDLLEAAPVRPRLFRHRHALSRAGRQLRATEALAEQRGIDLLNLAQVNELIIRRMKTGVLLVDDANRIHQINESAWMLMGNPAPTSATSASWRRSCRAGCTTG